MQVKNYKIRKVVYLHIDINNLEQNSIKEQITKHRTGPLKKNYKRFSTLIILNHVRVWWK